MEELKNIKVDLSEARNDLKDYVFYTHDLTIGFGYMYTIITMPVEGWTQRTIANINITTADVWKI